MQPEAYLHWQFAHMFVSFTRQPHKLSANIVQPMTDLSKRIGLVLHPGFLPLLQIGITEWKNVPYLGLLGKSFLWLKQRDELYASPGPPGKTYLCGTMRCVETRIITPTTLLSFLGKE